MRNKLIAAALMIWILSAGTAMAETLTLESLHRYCIGEAPGYGRSSGEVASKGAVGQSAADSRPQVSAGASYTRSDSTGSRMIQEGTAPPFRLNNLSTTGVKEPPDRGQR